MSWFDRENTEKLHARVLEVAETLGATKGRWGGELVFKGMSVEFSQKYRNDPIRVSLKSDYKEKKTWFNAKADDTADAIATRIREKFSPVIDELTESAKRKEEHRTAQDRILREGFDYLKRTAPEHGIEFPDRNWPPMYGTIGSVTVNQNTRGCGLTLKLEAYDVPLDKTWLLVNEMNKLKEQFDKLIATPSVATQD
jgi:hypothetical protein